MSRSDVITLIKLIPPAERVDEDGFPNKPIESSRVVFGGKKPTYSSEYFKAQQLGIKIDFKFEMRACEYEGESIAEYNGKRYKVERTEESKDGEYITLTMVTTPKEEEYDPQ